MNNDNQEQSNQAEFAPKKADKTTEQSIPSDSAKIIAGIIQAQIGTPGQHDIICAHMEEYFKRWPNYRSKFTSLEWYHIFLDFSDKLQPLPPSPVGEAGGIWVKASERLPKEAGEDNSVTIRGTGFGKDVFGHDRKHPFVTKGFKNFGEEPKFYFLIGNESFLTNENIEWLDESPNPSRAGDTKDDFVKGYACALVCIIQGHGISTEVEDAYKAGLPTPVSELKGRIDEFDYSILKKHFK